MTACNQAVDSVQIKPRQPQIPSNYRFIFNADLQGTTKQSPVSANVVMGIHQVGGSNVRTTSSSSSFRMTGGVGVD